MALRPTVGQAYRYGVVDVFAGEGASATLGNVQALGEDVQNLVVRRTEPGERSRTDWVSVEFGGAAVGQRDRQPAHRRRQRGAGPGRVLRRGQAAPGPGAA